ncbi:hypothetical protein L9F63_004729, partial [Diploptera punctata]
MHRFYVFHSFTHFHRNAMAAAALFLAAKVEEQPRKLEHVIKVAHMCLNRDQPPLDTKSEKYLEHAQDLVFNENVLLQTLGFDVAIDHPHTHVVRCSSKDLAQTSYFMASNSLHLTTMCLQYKPTVVACFCIHLACKWSNWEIPQSNEGKDWFWYVDKTVSLDQLEQLTAEFLVIFDKCPTKLKRKIMSISATQNPTLPPPVSGSLFDMEPRKIRPPDGSQQMDGPTFHPAISSSRPPGAPHHMQGEKPPSEKLQAMASSQQRVDYRDYKEKKERERMTQQQHAAVPREGHHAAVHASKSLPGSSSKQHAPAPPIMMNKPHHRDHKHPQPMRPSSSQPRGREQSYPKQQREHIFAPPVRHSEPQPVPETNHASVDSASKRIQQPGFEPSNRHNRVPPSDGRVKEEVSSKPVPDFPVRPTLPAEAVSEQKPNVNLHPAFSENRHESSRRSDSSKHLPYHQTQLKPDLSSVKKEDVEFAMPALPQQPPPPSHPTAPPHHKSSRSKSPPHSHSPAFPPRPKSPTPPNRRSDSPHGKAKSGTLVTSRNGVTSEEKSEPVKQEPPPPTIKLETEVSPVKVPSTQKSSIGTPDKQESSAAKLRSTNRHRTSSSSSEPELVPVVKKVPDIIPPIRDRAKKEEPLSQAPSTSNSRGNDNTGSVTKELKLPDLIGPIAAMRSTNMKPASLPDDLGAVAFPESDSTNGLKLKIMKDRLKDSDSTGSSPQSTPSGGLKIKIRREIVRVHHLVLPTKSARLNTSTGDQRRTGSSSNNYTKQNGVEHHRRGGGSYYPGNKVVQKMAESDNAGKSIPNMKYE